jgi:hypothetical protein
MDYVQVYPDKGVALLCGPQEPRSVPGGSICFKDSGFGITIRNAHVIDINDLVVLGLTSVFC